MQEKTIGMRPETLSALNIMYEAHHTSPIRVLTPIVLDVLYKADLHSISPEDFPRIKKLLSGKLGLNVPHHVVKLICEEAQREKLLIYNGPGKPLILNLQKVKEINSNFSAMEDESARKWERLVNEIIKRYSENGYGSISPAKVDNALLQFIKTCSSDFLLDNANMPDEEGFSQNPADYSTLTRVSMCIADIATDPLDENYKYLVDLCLGNTVASSVLWWDDEFNESHLDDLDVYIDSPILFRYLGFGDEGQEEVAKDLIEALLKRGAHLYVFEHVLAEVMDIFENTKVWIGNPEYDPTKASKTAQKVIERQLTAVDLEKIIDGIPDRLEEAKIIRREKVPANHLKEHQIDEIKLREMIDSAYEMRDRNMDMTIGVDVQSIGTINKLRSGETVLYLNKAKAVLCTSNRTLSEVSFEFEREEYTRPERAIPLCMTDNSLVTIAWLESPEKSRRIAQRRVIAQVNSLIEPTPALRKRYCEDLRNRIEAGLITEADYLAIIRESSINRILARKTGNDPNLYSGEALDDAIDAMLEIKAVQKNLEIRQRDEEIERQDKTIKNYLAREEKRADRWGRLLVAAFAVLLFIPFVLVSIFLAEFQPAVLAATIIADVLVLVFSEKIKQLGINLYKRWNSDIDVTTLP